MPELACSGATPLWRASCASVLKRLIGPISASSFAAVTAPQPGSSSSAGASRGGPLFEFLVELVDRSRERAAAGDELACDPHLDVLLAPCQPAADALEVTRTVESAQRDDQGRVELVQVPAQPLLGPPPLVDEIIAMINQQLDLAVHPLTWLRPRQVRLAQRRPATASASIGSDFPRTLPARRSGTVSFGETRTNSSPSPSSCRSSHGVNSRQSSIAHNRSASSADAQPISSSLPTATVRSSSIRPASSTATAVTDCLCTSTPITII